MFAILLPVAVYVAAMLIEAGVILTTGSRALLLRAMEGIEHSAWQAYSNCIFVECTDIVTLVELATCCTCSLSFCLLLLFVLLLGWYWQQLQGAQK